MVDINKLPAVNPFTDELRKVAADLAKSGRGILAGDEGADIMESRFKPYNIPNTPENRQAWREILFTSPFTFENYISGVIMVEETLKGSTKSGISFVEILRKRGVYSGFTLDKGGQKIPDTDDEVLAIGFDGLEERAKMAYQAGARFAKWRAALKISKTAPSKLCVEENAKALAKYALVCQANGLVPIIEPDISMTGDHLIEANYIATYRALAACVSALNEIPEFIWDGAVFKPNMVVAGLSSPDKSTPQRVAQLTLDTVFRTIPPALPGILFLSGGLSEDDATEYLQAINKLANEYNKTKPWSLSFCFGRALQQTALKAWGGNQNNAHKAQEAFYQRAQNNSLASTGKFLKTN